MLASSLLMTTPAFRARPTIYEGIKMRSRLEATWAAHLDELGLTWEYEPVCFACPSGQYLPDFRIHDRNRPLYLEVKGVMDAPAVRMRMEIIWSSEPDATLVAVEGPPKAVIPFPGDDPEVAPDWWMTASRWQSGCWISPMHLVEWLLFLDGGYDYELLFLDWLHRKGVA